MKRLVREGYVNSGSETHAEHADAEAQRRSSGVQDAGSDDDDETDEEDVESVDAVEDQFLALEEEVATLVADVHDLALYTKLNITGFMKILKVRFRCDICSVFNCSFCLS